MSSERKVLLRQAKHASNNKCYNDLLVSLEGLAKLKEELSLDERGLISNVIRKAIHGRRDRIRSLKTKTASESIGSRWKDREEAKQTELKVLEREYRSAIERILYNIVEVMLPYAKDYENIVYLQKINADLHRYLAEMAEGDLRFNYAQIAMDAYKQACDVALIHMPVTNTTRLGLLLNFAVFFYEIVESPRRAIAIVNATAKDLRAAGEIPDTLGRVYFSTMQRNRELWMDYLRMVVRDNKKISQQRNLKQNALTYEQERIR